MAGGRVVGYAASANACSEFASRSRQSSIPTEMRTNPSVTRASAISCALLPGLLRYREGVTEARSSLPANGAETLVIDTGMSRSASPSCPAGLKCVWWHPDDSIRKEMLLTEHRRMAAGCRLNRIQESQIGIPGYTGGGSLKEIS